MQVQIFVSYAHEDVDHKNRLVSELQALEQSGLVRLWHDQKIGAGEPFGPKILENIDSSDFILLLISPSFLASEYCRLELKHTEARFKAGECQILPILIANASGWDKIKIGSRVLGDLQALPHGGLPIVKWSNKDHSWRVVVQGIAEAVRATVRSPRLDQLQAGILSSVGIFVFDSIATFFEIDSWQHYYIEDKDAELDLNGEVEVIPGANRITLNGYSDEYVKLQTVATINYEPHLYRFRYSISQPPVGEQYHFQLAVSAMGTVVARAIRVNPGAAEVESEMSLHDLLKFLRRTFREQKETCLNKPAARKKSGAKKSSVKKAKRSTSAH